MSLFSVQIQRRKGDDARKQWAEYLGVEGEPANKAAHAKSAGPAAQQSQQPVKKGPFRWVSQLAKKLFCCSCPQSLP